MTRLRVKVREDADVEKLKKVDGVLNVVEAETLQIVLGPGKVNSVGEEFSKLTGMPLGFSDNNVERCCEGKIKKPISRNITDLFRDFFRK